MLEFHYAYTFGGMIARFGNDGSAVHYDSMGRRVNYVTLFGRFVGWIDS